MSLCGNKGRDKIPRTDREKFLFTLNKVHFAEIYLIYHFDPPTTISEKQIPRFSTYRFSLTMDRPKKHYPHTQVKALPDLYFLQKPRYNIHARAQ